jgi:predicted nucleic acid-binding protein
MTSYLLDTNALADYFNDNPNVIARTNNLPTGADLFISAITFGEVSFGHARTRTTDSGRREEYERFVRNKFHTIFTVPVTAHTASYYGPLKAKLFEMHPPKSKK